ncbi:hypothetical protein BH11PSE12_BH11PSE12_18500 [soil metagenome]
MLSANAQLLISLIGEAAAFRLMQIKHYGGRGVFIPKHETGHGEQAFAALAEIIGYDHAKRIAKTFGGEKLYIPSCTYQLLYKRNCRIVIAYNNGASVAELCREYELSDRQIQSILKKTDLSQTELPLIKQTELF